MTRTIIPTHPKAPARKPTIDEIISAYLAKFHHIHIRPVSSNVSPSPATNALMGAIGPDAVYANTVVTQQGKAAQLQEWLQMKTFALNQPDFPEYRDQCFAKYEEGLLEYEQKKQDYLAQLRTPEVQAELARRQRRQSFVLYIALAIIGVTFAGQQVKRFLDHQRTQPVTSEMMSKIDPENQTKHSMECWYAV